MELAILVYFWRDITRTIGRWCAAVTGRVPRSDPDARMGWLIIVGSIPVAVLGLLLQDWIDTEFRSLRITAAVLTVLGVLLTLAGRSSRQITSFEKLTVRGGVFYGLAQALALVLSVSCLGDAIATGLAVRYTRPAAARYAFLLVMPTVFASGLYRLYTSSTDPDTQDPYDMGETLVATRTVPVAGYAATARPTRFIGIHSLLPFVWYRTLLNGVLLTLLGAGIISA